MKKFILVFILLPFFLYSESIYPTSLEAFIKEMYLQEKSDLEMVPLYEELLKTFTATKEQAFAQANENQKATSLLVLAALEYYMGRVYQSIDSIETEIEKNTALRGGRLKSLVDFHVSREKIIKHHELSLEYIKNIEALDDEAISATILSEMYALKSEVLNQLCLFKSIDFSIKNFANVDKNARKALSLDPYNIRAFLMVVSSWIYCPPIYGGKPNKALDEMDKFNWPQKLREEDRYNYLLSKAYCYMRNKNNSLATSYLEKALAIYPTNAFSNAMKKIIANGGF